jgi:bacterial/archaeal transporter family-2 protein
VRRTVPAIDGHDGPSADTPSIVGPMERGLAVVVMALAGGAVAIQPALNAGLSRATGSLPAALVSFLVGGLVLGAIVLLSGQLARVGDSVEVRWYYLLGGVCGAFWIATSLIAVKSLGAGGVVAATITGQLTGAVVADRLGVLGLTEVPITAPRVLGVLLLIAGTYLVVR